jgi:hypothetical protein
VTLGPRRLSVVDYHPAVGAVILSNTLRGCVQVRDMVDLCQNSPSREYQDSLMCHTARRYYNDSCRREESSDHAAGPRLERERCE